MTWNVARGGVAVATDTSEVYAVSAAVGLGELSEAASIGGELVVADSAVGVSAVVGPGELSAADSIGCELVVADSAAATSGVVRLESFCGLCPPGGLTRAGAPAVA